MKTVRLKNIVIVLLAALDVFLLAVLVGRRLEEQAARERLVKELTTLFESGGIALDVPLLPAGEVRLAPLEPARDLEAEDAFALAVLGECEREDVGGGIYRYVGGSGQCLLRSGGSVEASLRRDAGDPEAFASRLFSGCGYAVTGSSLDGGTGSVTAVRVSNGARVFNAQLTLSFEEGALTGVEGAFVPGFEPAERGGGLDGVTALVRFLDYSRSSGEVCTAVTRSSGGYLLQSTASAPLRLMPVWCVETDVYRYYVNIVNGEVTREA